VDDRLGAELVGAAVLLLTDVCGGRRAHREAAPPQVYLSYAATIIWAVIGIVINQYATSSFIAAAAVLAAAAVVAALVLPTRPMPPSRPLGLSTSRSRLIEDGRGIGGGDDRHQEFTCCSFDTTD
jgi:hypothetical protein